MPIRTLIIGHVPLTDMTGAKPRQLKENAHFKELFSHYELGEVHYSSHEGWKQKADELNPLFIIYLGHDYGAQAVHDYKPDAMLYATYDGGQIFYRKAEMEEKIVAQHKTLKEVDRMVREATQKGEEHIAFMRQFSAMSYNDLYEMIKKGIMSEDKKTHDSAWDLLFGKGERPSNIIWMRAQFLAETWEKADGKAKEELMCMTMDEYITEGMARKLDDFSDADGQRYHQYMFIDFHGHDLNYIRRIPYGDKGQNGHSYVAILERYETPANFLRLKIEVSQMCEQKEAYFKGEVTKVAQVLSAWKEDPARTKKELGVVGPYDEPLLDWELANLKDFLKKHDEATYKDIFTSISDPPLT